MAHGDKRSVATDALETLGTIIDERAARDAIHLAVEPSKAGERLRPGQEVGISSGLAYATLRCKKLGIVDPFLKSPVEAGQKFWLVVFPRQISSLRHVWTHPDFPQELSGPLVPSADDEEILREGAGAINVEFHTFMAAIGQYLTDRERGSDEKSISFGDDIEYGDLPAGFWPAYERSTGRQVPESWRDVYFRCAC